MSPVEREARLELLLEHAGWIRSLARELVTDPDLVDEIEQRTLVAALSASPRPGVPFASWLGVVVRNFVLQHRRSEGRRHTHEVRAARSEELPSTDDVVERASVQRELVAAVMELDEPVRTTILLRFYDGCPPREVARRMDVPVETVRARTARGLALLRERLDRQHGGGRASWLGALLPLVQSESTGLGITQAGMWIMNSKWKLVVAVAVVLGVAAIVWNERGKDTGAARTVEEEKARIERPSSSSGGGTGGSSRSDSVRASAVSSSGATNTAPPPVIVRGKVVDSVGHGLAGLRVGVVVSKETKETRELARTNDLGAFEFPAQSDGKEIVDCEPDLAPLCVGTDARGGASREQVLVLARARALSATIVDESGATVAGARVAVTLDPSFRTRIPEVLDASQSVPVSARSDANGRVALTELPSSPDVRVSVSHDEYLAFEARLLDLAEATVITLTRPSGSAEGVLRGRVVDPAGRPVPAARVAFGIDIRRTDEEGSFAFQIDDPQSLGKRFGVATKTLTALAPGHQLAVFTPPSRNGELQWPAFVTLQLGAPPLSIAGVVLDTERNPLGGAKVWIMDATLFGGDEGGPKHVENLLASADAPRWRAVETDTEGRFEIDGLLDREYHVEAMDPSTLLRVQEGPFRAGAKGIELALPADALHPIFRGRVVSHRGTPVAGARVFPMCDTFRTRFDGRILGTSHEALEGILTAADGTFELVNVPKSLAYVRVQGEDILPLEYCRVGDGDDRFASDKVSRLPADKITDLEIVVDRRCHVQVVLADATSADEVSMLDAKGGVVMLNVYDGNSRETDERFRFAEGRTPAMAVSDAAVTVVLYKDGREVRRAPVALEPGPLKEMRL